MFLRILNNFEIVVRSEDYTLLAVHPIYNAAILKSCKSLRRTY